jgi:DNA polymerase-4
MGKPVIVGGRPESRGVVSTASYEARVYGIHSGMPAKEAKKLCPGAIFAPVRFDVYKKVSGQIRDIMLRYTQLIEPLSIDEAFLQIDDEKMTIWVAKQLKQTVKQELDLTASVGVSYNKFLAKLGSDMDKPDGFTVITPEIAADILPGLPVRKIWGIGPKTAHELHKVGLEKIIDIQKADIRLLGNILGKRAQEVLLLSKGIDFRPIETIHTAKSYSEETTFPTDISDYNTLEDVLSEFADALANRLKETQFRAKTVTLKVKYDDFSSITRSTTLYFFTNDACHISKYAFDLLDKTRVSGKKIRLIGLQVGNFLRPHDPEQMSINYY